jgi:hypothetical protein
MSSTNVSSLQTSAANDFASFQMRAKDGMRSVPRGSEPCAKQAERSVK